MSDDYTIALHSHRFAAWAAATAARSGRAKKGGYSVARLTAILESCGFDDRNLPGPDSLPSPEDIDERHEEWRLAIIKAAEPLGLTLTHGVAAKLINVYLKARFVLGGHHDHTRVRCLHPPIDSVLLERLAIEETKGLDPPSFWLDANKGRWSFFGSKKYQEVISQIRLRFPDSLWEVEKHWQGFRGGHATVYRKKTGSASPGNKKKRPVRAVTSRITDAISVRSAALAALARKGR